MQKYNSAFRMGKIEKEIHHKESFFTNFFNNFNLDASLFEFDKSLPNNSILNGNELLVLIYPGMGRNMVIQSRIFEVFDYLSKNYLVTIEILPNAISQITDSSKKDLFMLHDLGVKITSGGKAIDDFFNKFELKKLSQIISSRGNTKKLSYSDSEIIANGENGKNIARASLIYIYGLKNKLNFTVNIVNGKWRDVEKFNTAVSIGEAYIRSPLLLFADLRFDGKNILNSNHIMENLFNNAFKPRLQKEGMIQIERESNLYKKHDDVTGKVINKYVSEGFRFMNEKFGVDLLLEKNGMFVLAEIKGEPSRDNVFKAFGQLFFYKDIIMEVFGIPENAITMKFISTGLPNIQMESFLKKNSILCEVYNA